MQDLHRALAEHPFVRTLSAEQLQRLGDFAAQRVFHPGQFLLREGQVADALYLLCGGQVSLEIQVPGRGPQQVESLRAGDIIGLSWLFPPQRWELDARAVESAEAIAFDAPRLRAKMDEDHELAWALSRGILFHLYQRLGRVRLQRLDVYAAEKWSGR